MDRRGTVNRRSPNTSWKATRVGWGLATGLAVLFVCGVLLVRPSSSEVPAAARVAAPKAAAPGPLALPDVQPIAQDVRAPNAIAVGTSKPQGSAGVAGSLGSNFERQVAADEQAPGRPSHPVTSDRQRIYRENNLNAALMGAMNVRDHQGLRALIEEYRLDYPEDTHRLQEGYTLIADCLEKLTPELQAKARQYWKAKRGSPVRRFIRQHCLLGGAGSAGQAELAGDRASASQAG